MGSSGDSNSANSPWRVSRLLVENVAQLLISIRENQRGSDEVSSEFCHASTARK